jgi:hypothetical protein
MPPYYLPELHGVINRHRGERGREKKRGRRGGREKKRKRRKKKKKMGLNEGKLLPYGMLCLDILFSCSKIQGTRPPPPLLQLLHPLPPKPKQVHCGHCCVSKPVAEQFLQMHVTTLV